MENMYASNPRDESKDRFVNMEAQISNIACNMVILIATLERNFRPFKEFGSSKSDTSSKKKYKDKEEPNKEIEKDPKKERPNYNITSSHSLFKLEAKVDIKPYQGEIDAFNLNQ
jgi:hypothetical protein